MAILKFELPDTAWKVTKKYGLFAVPLEDIEKVINYYEIYYFQDEQMAREIQSSFEIGQEEIVDLGNYSYKLPVFATLEKVNIIDYVPKVLDF
jgi:hypothetical protein